MSSDAERLFAEERSNLMAVAYRMLGSVSEAEDVLQDVFERWLGGDRSAVDRPGAYLTTMTTRISIDRLRSAQKVREVYVGPWLPEPVVTPDDPTDPAAVAELDESLTIGYLHLLEQLTPVERAVHLLHEVFDFSYREISTMVDKEEANCRQIGRRAAAKLKASRPDRLDVVAPEVEASIVATFVDAVTTGDVERTMSLFTDEVVHISDGGADHHAARKPVVGPERVARFLVNLAKRMQDVDPGDLEVEAVRVNLQPGLLVLIEGRPITLVVLEIVEAGIRRIHAVVNPDKLHAVMSYLHR